MLVHGASLHKEDTSYTRAYNAFHIGHVAAFLANTLYLESPQRMNFFTMMLSYSCQQGHFALVRCLVENGADIDDERWAGMTYGAVVGGHWELLRYLLKKGAPVNHHTLGAAIRGGRLPLVQFLVEECGVEVSRAMVEQAAEWGRRDLVEYLIGMTPDALNAALHGAALHGRFDMARWLIERGADLDVNGGPAMEQSVLRNNLEMVQWLAERGVRLNRLDDRYFYMAAKRGYLSLLQYMVRTGQVSTNISRGRAMRMAQAGGHHAVVDFLRREEAGAIVRRRADGASVRGAREHRRHAVDVVDLAQDSD